MKYYISKKSDASMKLELKNIDQKIIKNRNSFFVKNNINPQNVISAEIVHSNKIAIVSEKDLWKIIYWVDWLITNEKNLFLSVTFADCVPVFFYDEKKQVIWIIHAWRKWIVDNICESMISKFTDALKSNPKNIIVKIWPHIQSCHFEIKDDISYNFNKKYIINNDQKMKVNLQEIIKDQLLELWINLENIQLSDECTFCEKEKYFSYRRDKPKKVEAMIWVITIK